MKRCSSIFAAVLFLGLGSAAQAPPVGGWVPLFNGKDLTGWKKNGDEKWVVEQGTILCESTANKYGYLTTEKSYRDFTLRLKFKGEAWTLRILRPNSQMASSACRSTPAAV